MQATLRVLIALSFIAGFADTATFIHLFGLFSAHVTGNFVLLAAAIGKGVRENDILKLLSFPVFVSAAFGATLVHDRLRGGEPETAFDRRLTLTAGSLLIAGGLIALFFARKSEANDISFAEAIAGLSSVAAMGIQNAVHRFAVALAPPTTVMTGTVTQLTVMAARRLRGASEPASKAPAPAFSLRGLLLLAAAFAGGCLIAVPLTLVFGLVSLIAPGFLLIAAAVWERQA